MKQTLVSLLFSVWYVYMIIFCNVWLCTFDPSCFPSTGSTALKTEGSPFGVLGFGLPTPMEASLLYLVAMQWVWWCLLVPLVAVSDITGPGRPVKVRTREFGILVSIAFPKSNAAVSMCCVLLFVWENVEAQTDSAFSSTHAQNSSIRNE